jgi:hypothetical protein
LLGCGCTAGAEAPDDGDEIASEQAALDANSGKTVWAETSLSQYEFVLLGLDRSGNIYVRTRLQNLLFKYDPYGKLIWQRSLDNPERIYSGVQVAVVDADGNVTFAGDQRTLAEPGTNEPLYEHYIAKMAADGSMVFRRTWARAEGTAVWPKQIVVDGSGYFWVIGRVVGNADLGGGRLPDGENEGHRPYVAKYSLFGALLFAKTGPVTMRNVSNGNDMTAITPAVGGGVFMTGWTRQWWDLGCGFIYPTLPAPAAEDVGTGYLVKLDFNGNCATQRTFGYETQPTAVATSTDGRVAIGGTFRGTLDFGGKSLSNSTASPDIFLATFDVASGAVGWVKKASGTTQQRVGGLAFDSAGYLDVVGTIRANLDSTNRTFRLGTFETAFDGEAFRTFVGRFTPKTGATAWVRAYGDRFLVASDGIAVSSNNRIMAAGKFWGPADLGKGMVGAIGDRRRFLMRIYP